MKYDGLHPAERLRQVCKHAIDELPDDTNDEDKLERIADNLATHAAHVRDQLEGAAAPWSRHDQRSRGTITRRVRKALGYSYP